MQKVPDYARLSAAELNLTVTRTLVVSNPQAELNRTMYDYLERKNKENDAVDQLVIHLSLEGDYIHTGSNEYKIQEEIEYARKTKFEQVKRQAEQEEPGSGKNVEAIKQAMRNKFDYKSREVQTIYPSIKERGAATCPPITDNLRGEVTQWEIWDSYVE
jgi:dynein intermediate chain 1